jgi:hypothetical protein
MLVTNFAYSCKSSCSRGVNCGGGGFGCEVDRDSVEVMLWMVVFAESDASRFRKIGGQPALRSGRHKFPADQHPVDKSLNRQLSHDKDFDIRPLCIAPFY